MDNMHDYLALADFVAKVFIVPLCASMFKLSSAINDLKLSLHRDFVSNVEFEKRLDLEREITSKNETREARRNHYR